MKKSSFYALVMGTVSGMIFAIGMCMALLPEWDLFGAGVAFTAVGIVLGLITLIGWRKLEDKPSVKVNGKLLLKIVYITAAVLVFGLAMCLCLVWAQYLYGMLVGLVGVLMLLGLSLRCSVRCSSPFRGWGKAKFV